MHTFCFLHPHYKNTCHLDSTEEARLIFLFRTVRWGTLLINQLGRCERLPAGTSCTVCNKCSLCGEADLCDPSLVSTEDLHDPTVSPLNMCMALIRGRQLLHTACMGNNSFKGKVLRLYCSRNSISAKFQPTRWTKSGHFSSIRHAVIAAVTSICFRLTCLRQSADVRTFLLLLYPLPR